MLTRHYTRQSIKRVFISAPFRGTTPWEVEKACRAVDEVSAELSIYSSGRAIGIASHMNSRHFVGLMPDEYWIAAYENILSVCNAALFVSGWRDSSGCRNEHGLAMSLNIPRYYSINDLVEDLTAGAIK